MTETDRKLYQTIGKRIKSARKMPNQRAATFDQISNN